MGGMKNRRGFTMVELLIAVVVIGVTLLAMILGNTSVQQLSEKSFEKMSAYQDAHRTVELIRNASVTGTFPANVVNTFPPAGQVAGFNSLKNEQVTVSYTDPAADPLDITVTTTWERGDRRNGSIQLRTLMTQRTGG